jgi:hypothetical protein
MMPRCRLKPVRNPDKIKTWCGPGALSILTGNRVEYCARKIAKVRNEARRTSWFTPKRIQGVQNYEMRHALEQMGYQMIKLLDVEDITLGRWIDTYCTKHHRAIILVNVTDHYVVTHLGQVNDNRSKRPCPVQEHSSRRCKIQNAWIIQRRRKSS